MGGSTTPVAMGSARAASQAVTPFHDQHSSPMPGTAIQPGLESGALKAEVARVFGLSAHDGEWTHRQNLIRAQGLDGVFGHGHDANRLT
jgi:hypothetical protein